MYNYWILEDYRCICYSMHKIYYYLKMTFPRMVHCSIYLNYLLVMADVIDSSWTCPHILQQLLMICSRHVFFELANGKWTGINKNSCWQPPKAMSRVAFRVFHFKIWLCELVHSLIYSFNWHNLEKKENLQHSLL